MRTIKISACICTYNSASRIRAVLEALAIQTQPKESWEVLVIDNASTDGTGEVANRFIKEKLDGCGRVVREEQPGQSFARARAAREACGEIICFLDDDNIPAPDFVKNAIQAFKKLPQAGALGGKVLPVWESMPSALALAVQDFALAICDRGNKAFSYDARLGPVGAGLCIRAELLRKIYQEGEATAAVSGRKGKDCGGGDDLAIAVLVWRMGFERWYEPSLLVRHLLPEARMQKDYLLRLYAATGRSQAAVRRLSDWKARSPLAWLIGLKDLCRWQLCQWCGPSPELRQRHPEIATDLHYLNQSMTLGRARKALSWPR
jgi:glycosyltransferase involved in cell wall biosynthesis